MASPGLKDKGQLVEEDTDYSDHEYNEYYDDPEDLEWVCLQKTHVIKLLVLPISISCGYIMKTK